jgi:3-dehydroquinate synthase
MLVEVLRIESKLRMYEVKFADNVDFLADLSSPTLFIIDKNVWDFHGDGCLALLQDKDVLLLEVSEDKKNLQTVEELFREIIKRDAKKNLTIISIGGGITQDITGFICSTLYRGVRWIFVPTTLLAQADSCIGSKTSLNFDNFKNLIGTFYPPANVYIYSAFLSTQKQEDYFSGLGEVAKLHIIGGGNYTNDLIDNLAIIKDQANGVISQAIFNSLMIKKSFIEMDELDNGARNLLNYGHCIGHGLETISDYRIPHGQAVVAGMILANIIAHNRGLLAEDVENFLYGKLLLPILSIDPAEMLFDEHLLIEAMKKDKKRIDHGIPIVMLLDGYEMHKFNNLSESEIIDAINEFRNRIQV